MPTDRPRPFLLPPMVSASSLGSRCLRLNGNIRNVSVDLDPIQQEILSLPSPYHDSSSPHDHNISSHERNLSQPMNIFAMFFNDVLRFRYTRVDQNDVENGKDEDEDGDDDQEKEEQKRTRLGTYEESYADRWMVWLLLMLFLSLLVNLFLMFNGPVGCLPHTSNPKHK